MRMVTHNTRQGFSVGAIVDDKGDVYVTYAVCCYKDQFSRKRGFKIVNDRLNLRQVRDSIPIRKGDRYRGDNPGKDVFGPLRKEVKAIDLSKFEPTNSVSRLRAVILGIDRALDGAWINQTLRA